MIVTWLSLALAAVLAVASASYLIGRLSKAISGLEDQVEENGKTITHLSEAFSGLERQVEGHETSIKAQTSILRQDITSLRGESRGDIHSLRDEIVAFRKEQDKNIEAARKDLSDLIQEVRALRSKD